MTTTTGGRWGVVTHSLLLVASTLAAASVGFAGVVAASDSSPAPGCSALSWTTQTVSGETYYEVDSLDKLQCIENRGFDSNYVQTQDIDASESGTPYGDLTGYEWSVAEPSGETTAVTLDGPGEYTVALTVTNDAGRTATVTETATGTPSSTSSSEDGGMPVETTTDAAGTTPNGSGGLGLGPAVSIVAILALSVLAVRRR